jgi:hypothetical protein
LQTLPVGDSRRDAAARREYCDRCDASAAEHAPSLPLNALPHVDRFDRPAHGFNCDGVARALTLCGPPCYRRHAREKAVRTDAWSRFALS